MSAVRIAALNVHPIKSCAGIGGARRATFCWDGRCAGFDEGPEAARAGALTRFSDGFPRVVTSTASLAALGERLARAGLPPAGMNRFRPNLVLDGLDGVLRIGDAVEPAYRWPSQRTP